METRCKSELKCLYSNTLSCDIVILTFAITITMLCHNMLLFNCSDKCENIHDKPYSANPVWWKWLACWQRTFTVNYRGSPRRHRHCDSRDDSNDTLMTRLLTHVNRHTISILPQWTEDHVSRQLYNKDHLPLGWLSGGYSTQRHKQRQGLCGTSARSGFQVQSPWIFALLADPHPK